MGRRETEPVKLHFIFTLLQSAQFLILPIYSRYYKYNIFMLSPQEDSVNYVLSMHAFQLLLMLVQNQTMIKLLPNCILRAFKKCTSCLKRLARKLCACLRKPSQQIEEVRFNYQRKFQYLQEDSVNTTQNSERQEDCPICLVPLKYEAELHH